MSDSTTIANGELAQENAVHAATHAAHPPYQRHHFESVAQQFDATNFAMWLFLLTEIMFFGGLFTSYLIMRNWYYQAFVEGSHHLSIFWGTTNTAVLITSSFTMAMGVWCAQMRRKAALVLFLSLTFFLGIVFLCIKGIEWHQASAHVTETPIVAIYRNRRQRPGPQLADCQSFAVGRRGK